jgi:3-hydroxyisobutyrate dehydrogenase-like beta-hydroxyacid dehydrogenase
MVEGWEGGRFMYVSTAACWSSKVNNPHPVVAAAMDKETGLGPPACRDYQGGFGACLMLKDLTLAVDQASSVST